MVRWLSKASRTVMVDDKVPFHVFKLCLWEQEAAVEDASVF
jgi:hypothetical protein